MSGLVLAESTIKTAEQEVNGEGAYSDVVGHGVSEISPFVLK
jgi:hypothetical protein